MKHKTVKRGLIAALALGVAGFAGAAPSSQDNDQGVATLNAESTTRMETQFSDFAGSDANAQSLVQALRTGSTVNLMAQDGSSVSFAVPTSTMGNGEVAISLGLAQQSLANAGITDPTPQQLQAALVGGTVTTADGDQVQLAGVLAERQAGMAWGRIAQADGVKLGKLVGGIERAHGAVEAERAETHEVEQPGHDTDRGSATAGAHGTAHADEADHPSPESAHFNVAATAHGNADVGVEKPQITRPQVSKPEINRPDIGRPEIERPQIQKPDIERPNVGRPDQ